MKSVWKAPATASRTVIRALNSGFAIFSAASHPCCCRSTSSKFRISMHGTAEIAPSSNYLWEPYRISLVYVWQNKHQGSHESYSELPCSLLPYNSLSVSKSSNLLHSSHRNAARNCVVSRAQVVGNLDTLTGLHRGACLFAQFCNLVAPVVQNSASKVFKTSFFAGRQKVATETAKISQRLPRKGRRAPYAMLQNTVMKTLITCCTRLGNQCSEFDD